MLEIVEVKETQVLSIDVDGILKEEIEVFKLDDDLVPLLQMQYSSSRTMVVNGIFHNLLKNNDGYRTFLKIAIDNELTIQESLRNRIK